MNNVFYNLKTLVPYLIWYIVLFIFFSIALVIISGKKVKSNNTGFYGMFLNLDNRKILSISLLMTYLFVVGESIIVNNFSYVNLFVFIILSCLCNIIVLNYKYILISTLYSIFIYYVLFFQKIFINYTSDIDVLWYIVILIIAISIFAFLASIYFVVNNLNSICFKKDNAKKNYVNPFIKLIRKNQNLISK